jgi:hypothetical protein
MRMASFITPQKQTSEPNLRLVHPELFTHKSAKAEIQAAKATQDGEAFSLGFCLPMLSL